MAHQFLYRLAHSCAPAQGARLLGVVHTTSSNDLHHSHPHKRDCVRAFMLVQQLAWRVFGHVPQQ